MIAAWQWVKAQSKDFHSSWRESNLQPPQNQWDALTIDNHLLATIHTGYFTALATTSSAI